MEHISVAGKLQDEKAIEVGMENLYALSSKQLEILYNQVLGLGVKKGHKYLNPLVDAALYKTAKKHFGGVNSEILDGGKRYYIESEPYLISITHDGYGFLTYEATDIRLLPDETSSLYDVRTRDPKKAIVFRIGTYNPPNKTLDNLAAWLFLPESVLREAASYSDQAYMGEEDLDWAIMTVLNETYTDKWKRRARRYLKNVKERFRERADPRL